MRQLSTRIIEFAKTNSGALIIGASLIIGLNFSRFINYAEVAIYHLLGQAGADEAALEAARANNQAAQERERIAQAATQELVRIEGTARQDFLIPERTKFSQQVRVVRNSFGGDYLCMGFSAAEDAASYEVRDNIADDFVQWLNSNGLLDRRDWKYDDLKGFSSGPYAGCWSADNLWRANRYQKRIE
jgi:hypothetical protein